MELKMTGFASPAQGYEEKGIDLNSLLIHNPPATYFGRLETNKMEALGLPQGSLLVVDRSINPSPYSFVLIRHEGEFLCRQFLKQGGKTVFTDGVSYILPITGETEIIGTITASIKEYINGNAH
jgi:DNA polymerase V